MEDVSVVDSLKLYDGKAEPRKDGTRYPVLKLASNNYLISS
jgi:hypothetical protein